MKTRIVKSGDTIIVAMEGTLDFGTHVPLRENLNRLIRSASKTDSAPKHIIFDLQNLQFVGSSGISPFVQTLKDFNEASPVKPRYTNVRSEFQKIIRAFDEGNGFDIDEAPARGGRKQYDQ